jgi:hypothetical protein
MSALNKVTTAKMRLTPHVPGIVAATTAAEEELAEDRTLAAAEVALAADREQSLVSLGSLWQAVQQLSRSQVLTMRPSTVAAAGEDVSHNRHRDHGPCCGADTRNTGA